MGKGFEIEIVEACDPFEVNFTRESPRQIDPHRSLMSGSKRIQGSLAKPKRYPSPQFHKGGGGQKLISVFDDSCTPKASIYAVEGGVGLQLQQWLTRSQQNTGSPPCFHAKSGLFCP